MVLAYVGYSVVESTLERRRLSGRLPGLEPTRPAQPEPDVGADRLPTIARMLSSYRFASRIMMMLHRAGLKLRPSEFVGIVSGLSLGLALLAAVTLRTLQAELLALAIGIGCSLIYVTVLQARRLAAFNRQLPDALALIGSAIRSGYTFQTSLKVVAEEMPSPICDEVRRVLDDDSVGRPLDQSLMAMLERVPSYDLELVVVAVIIQQEVGGNLGEIIDNIGATIRDRVRVEGELAALTAEGRLSGIILQVLPFAMAAIILVLNPSYLQPLLVNPLGKALVVVGLSLQVVGAILIKRMLVLDY